MLATVNIPLEGHAERLKYSQKLDHFLQFQPIWNTHKISLRVVDYLQRVSKNKMFSLHFSTSISPSRQQFLGTNSQFPIKLLPSLSNPNNQFNNCSLPLNYANKIKSLRTHNFFRSRITCSAKAAQVVQAHYITCILCLNNLGYLSNWDLCILFYG